MIAAGMTEAEILRDFPDLEQEDIWEVPRFTAAALLERRMPQVGQL
jgi:uncharacterized protein (DUF433 family)